MEALLGGGIFIGLAVVIFIALIIGYIWFKRSYKAAKSNEAMIITGKQLGSGENVFTDEENGRRLKVVRGGGVFIKPLVQVAERVDMTTSQLMVKTPSVYTSQGVPVVADAVAMVRIGSGLSQIANFAEQFLGKNREDRDGEIVEVLEGHLRSALSSLTVEEIYQDREAFNRKLQEVADKDLSRMGFEITSFALKDIRDDNGYLEALGRPRIAEAKKNADIAESTSERETRIHQAQMDKEAEESELQRRTEIASAKKDNQIKEAEYKRENEAATAKADQAYELEKSKADRQLKDQEMDIRATELKREAELDEIEIKRKENQYEADVERKADAERYASNQRADAEKYRVIAEAESHAESERRRGEAEAEVLRNRGLAEANAKEQMAVAMAKYGDAAKLEMIINMLPAFAKEVSAPLNNIDSVKVIDTGGGKGESGVTGFAGSITNNMAMLQDTLKEATGIDIKELLESYAGVDTQEEFTTPFAPSSQPVEKNPEPEESLQKSEVNTDNNHAEHSIEQESGNSSEGTVDEEEKK